MLKIPNYFWSQCRRRQWPQQPQPPPQEEEEEEEEEEQEEEQEHQEEAAGTGTMHMAGEAGQQAHLGHIWDVVQQQERRPLFHHTCVLSMKVMPQWSWSNQGHDAEYGYLQPNATTSAKSTHSAPLSIFGDKKTQKMRISSVRMSCTKSEIWRSVSQNLETLIAWKNSYLFPGQKPSYLRSFVDKAWDAWRPTIWVTKPPFTGL